MPDTRASWGRGLPPPATPPAAPSGLGVGLDVVPTVGATLRDAAAAGFTHVELRLLDAEPDALHHAASWRTEARRAAVDLGLSVSLHAVAGLNLGEKLPRLRRTSIDILVETVAAADALGARWVTVHLGSAGLSPGHPRLAERIHLAADALARVLARTRGTRVRLAVENVAHLPDSARHAQLGSTPAHLAAVHDTLGPDAVASVFDLGHTLLGGYPIAPDAILDAMAPTLVAAHLHTNDGDRDQHHALDASTVARCARPLARLAAAVATGRVVPIFENHSLVEARRGAAAWTVFTQPAEAR